MSVAACPHGHVVLQLGRTTVHLRNEEFRQLADKLRDLERELAVEPQEPAWTSAESVH